MGRLMESLERREQPRVRWELPCTLRIEGRRHRGLVREVSAWGLFVQTPEPLPPGSDVIVELKIPEGRRFVLEAKAPHRRPVSHSLAAHSTEGVGLHIQDPSRAYRRWVGELGSSES
jgi:hypothetical protein